MNNILLACRTALAFLTILPLRLPEALPPGVLAASTVFFPLAGWLLGLLLAAAAWLAVAVAVPPLAAGALLAGLHLWLTRGLHLDGWADLLDGLGGGHTPERRLAIMKDSAIGVFGAAGVALLLLVKAASLGALLPESLTPQHVFLLAAPPVASRWAMAMLAWRSRYPRETGTGQAFVGQVRTGHLLAGFLFLLPLSFAGPPALVVLAASLLPSLWLRLKAKRALGGVTGDVLGAACELGEAAGWLAAAVLL